MRHWPVALAVVAVLTSAAAQAPPTPSATIPPTATAAATDTEYVAALRAQIRGREREPAQSVFTNIQTLQGRPAAAVISIMEIGYSKSLGVGCAHCHDTSDWASDAKAEKQVARQMSAMVKDINERLLPGIKGIKSERPTVNCTTCHRGHQKPALDLEPTPTPGP
ncbi:MAG TPA: c-type cytochrome [Thermoanaerobaculia bacterium]|nr:c-type cytochrome [Thermoanaerobaculia bacterium]